MQLNTLMKALNEWHQQKYGGPMLNYPGTVRKLHEELGEFLEALMLAQQLQYVLEEGSEDVTQEQIEEALDNLAEEYADVIFMLTHLISGAGVTNPTFAVKKKLGIIHQRLQDPQAGRKPHVEEVKPDDQIKVKMDWSDIDKEGSPI